MVEARRGQEEDVSDKVGWQEGLMEERVMERWERRTELREHKNGGGPDIARRIQRGGGPSPVERRREWIRGRRMRVEAHRLSEDDRGETWQEKFAHSQANKLLA